MDKFWEFLGGFSKEKNLFLLSLSIVLLLTAIGGSIPVLDISLPVWGKVLLSALALFMFAFSFRSMDRQERLEHSRGSQESKIQQLNEQIVQEQSKTQQIQAQLDKRIEELNAIQEVISSKDDPVSLEIARVLARVSQHLTREQVSSKDLAMAAEWINQRAADWSSNIPRTDMVEFALTDEKLKVLHQEIRQHIYLLSRNLVDGVFGSPRKKKIPQSLGSPLIYKRALMSIQERMEKELENSRTKEMIGGDKVCQEIKNYMNALIEDT